MQPDWRIKYSVDELTLYFTQTNSLKRQENSVHWEEKKRILLNTISFLLNVNLKILNVFLVDNLSIDKPFSVGLVLREKPHKLQNAPQLSIFLLNVGRVDNR